MLSLNPYLVYNGDCEAAFNFYNVIFGAETLYLARDKEVPQEARKFFPNAGDEDIMHGTLIINEKTVIMGNDSLDASRS
jgi:PhnB protein